MWSLIWKRFELRPTAYMQYMQLALSISVLESQGNKCFVCLGLFLVYDSVMCKMPCVYVQAVSLLHTILNRTVSVHQSK
jgi:hypothetical protein